MVKCRLKRSVVLHNRLHGFMGGREIGTATLEAKLSHKLAGLVHEPLFQVFLDVPKAYDFLDRGRCLKILREYRLGLKLA